MSLLPQDWQEFVSEGKRLLELHAVHEPLFARGTYQVQIKGPKEKAEYPFLQLSDQGDVIDAFCSCKISEKGKGCPHLSAAYQRIVLEEGDPLHIRFSRCFWNQLFYCIAKEVGLDARCLNEEHSRKISIQGDATRLQEILHPTSESEETSIKFSNWSTEELQVYRSGLASFDLLYELSFWADLAKWLLFLQEEKTPYEVIFHGEKIPSSVQIIFPEQVEIQAAISLQEWPFLIESLKTIHSSISVFREEGLSIVYDEERRGLKITHPLVHQKNNEEGIFIDRWRYVPKKGFFLQEELGPCFSQDWIGLDQMGKILSSHTKFLSEYLPIHHGEKSPQYELKFDEHNALHLVMWLFEEGDLLQEKAAYFFPWVYLPKKGFFRLRNAPFEKVKTIIPSERVADFINGHRLWLQQFPGFQIHVSTVEANLEYEVTADQSLILHTVLDSLRETQGVVPFDEWLYIPGQGFYMQDHYRGTLPMDRTIPRDEIERFIGRYTEELEQIKGFFSAEPLLMSLGLALKLNQEKRIVVEPKAEYSPGVDAAKVIDFGSVLYVANRGFYKIPLSQQVPEKYRTLRTISEEQESTFLAYEWEVITPFIVEVDPKLRRPKQLELSLQEIQKTKGKFRLELIYVSEIGKVSPWEIWEGLRKKKAHIFSNAGLLFLKQTRFQWIKKLMKRNFDKLRKWICFSPLEWIYLAALEYVTPPKETRQMQLFAEFSQMKVERPLDLSCLQSTLRPYQEQGVEWLWFLYCHGLSGLLCDDMGLGKTHQAMALLTGICQEDQERKNKYLIVCPTSVIYHWEELLKKFLPGMRVCMYYGLDRSLERFYESCDILLTSYGILRSSQDKICTFHFELAIFDEVQIAKNHASLTHRVLTKVKSTMRLGLTGTPIENRIRELKALFDVVLPSYMPPEALFRDLFIIPIEKEGDEQTKGMLQRMVRPFMLRRKKSEVLKDLPLKIEEIAYCDLSEEQRALYQETAQKGKGFLEDLKDPSKPVPYIHIFSILSSLKQICDHPALFYHDVKHAKEHESGKWNLFVELLQEARGSGQKVVVFSQYLDMIAMIENFLTQEGIGYASIKGSTRDRKEQIERFREDPLCEVFVASLLAAGVGIDLTAASVVIHYDRWWNPAKEAQATDRVHRIGQNRGVQVFKLVTKHTIEEEIHLLIEKKKNLLEEIVSAEEEVKLLSREELIEVFEKLWKE